MNPIIISSFLIALSASAVSADDLDKAWGICSRNQNLHSFKDGFKKNCWSIGRMIDARDKMKDDSDAQQIEDARKRRIEADKAFIDRVARDAAAALHRSCEDLCASASEPMSDEDQTDLRRCNSKRYCPEP